jgi:hypothetical protein
MGTDTVVGAMVVSELNIFIKAILGSRPTIESGIPIKTNWMTRVIPKHTSPLYKMRDGGNSRRKNRANKCGIDKRMKSG